MQGGCDRTAPRPACDDTHDMYNQTAIKSYEAMSDSGMAYTHGIYYQTAISSYEAVSDDGMAYQRCQPPLGGASQAHLLLSHC